MQSLVRSNYFIINDDINVNDENELFFVEKNDYQFFFDKIKNYLNSILNRDYNENNEKKNN